MMENAEDRIEAGYIAIDPEIPVECEWDAPIRITRAAGHTDGQQGEEHESLI